MDSPNSALSPFGHKVVGASAHDLSPQAQQFLMQRARLQRYAPGEEIYRHRVPTSHATWLRAGRLKVSVLQTDGQEQFVGWLMPPAFVGVPSVLLQCGVPANICADSDGVEVLHFTREVLLAMMVELPEAAVGISLGLSRMMTQQYDILDANGPRTLSDKLRNVLVWWARHYGLPALDGSVELWVAQNDLANGVGASRQRVHLELQSLRDLGEIDLGYRKIIIRPLFFEKMKFSPWTGMQSR